MKKIFLFCSFCALALSVHAQNVMIANSLSVIPNSSALAQYNNLFGQWNMPDKDEPFPFAVIRVDLLGNEESVRAAKLKLGFDVGTMQRIESDVRTEPNKILVLVPREVRNIYLTCGDGCERQVLFSGRLESNMVYSCQVEYQTAASAQATDGNDALLQEMKALREQMAMMQQGQTTQPSQSTNINNQQQTSQTTTQPQTSPVIHHPYAQLSGPIIYDGRRYYCDNEQIVLRDFLQERCPAAYSYWKKNNGLKIGGWVVTCCGLASALMGLLPSKTKEVTTTQTTTSVTATKSSSTVNMNLIMAAVGSTITCIGVVMCGVGHSHCTKKAHEVYNRQCAYQPKMTLNLQSSQDGIGLAFKF